MWVGKPTLKQWRANEQTGRQTHRHTDTQTDTQTQTSSHSKQTANPKDKCSTNCLNCLHDLLNFALEGKINKRKVVTGWNKNNIGYQHWDHHKSTALLCFALHTFVSVFKMHNWTASVYRDTFFTLDKLWPKCLYPVMNILNTFIWSVFLVTKRSWPWFSWQLVIKEIY